MHVEYRLACTAFTYFSQADTTVPTALEPRKACSTGGHHTPCALIPCGVVHLNVAIIANVARWQPGPYTSTAALGWLLLAAYLC